jgi:hypothetical protein
LLEYISALGTLSNWGKFISKAKGLLYHGLMDAEAWPELVVGLAVLTGQKLVRILKTGRVARETAYSILFRDISYFDAFSPHPFEIPTLGRADLVVEAWERVQQLVIWPEEQELCELES